MFETDTVRKVLDSGPRPKVFVTQFFVKGDFSKAETWGEVVFLTEREHKPEPTHRDYNVMTVAQVKRGLADYVPGIDYLLVSPNNIINLIVGSMLPVAEHKILKWNNRVREYRLHIYHNE